ncbi:phytoene/squalene synthase family protein [Jeotgalicoccus halotolerans]|uniref:4,4'-diapophytoene synthase n=1 Tax=Jeotgalicoccus halotolerans TaxID=157227 RepID=A0A3E0AXH4_9STAP|nr:phytoene synthase [Jeotgalicoccus halotolerans]
MTNSQRGDKVNQLKLDYKYCESVIKKHSKSFYYAFSNLNTPDRNAVYAIYAFCRMADDAVDNATELNEKINNIDRIRDELDCFAEGSTPDTPLWRALEDVKNNYNISLDLMYKQLDGQQMDINFIQPETIYDLEHYSTHVAGSVGLLLLPIICSRNTEIREHGAQSLGVAMQYTNILRDVGEDFKTLDRIYLPKEWTAEYQITARDLSSGKITPDFINLWEKVALEAEKKYDAFMDEIVHYKPEAQLGLMLSVLIYRELLDEVRRNQYDCLNKRQVVSLVKKTKIKMEAEKMLKSMRVGNSFG